MEYPVPDRDYIITIEPESVFCSCPAMRFGKGRECKHITAMRESNPEHFESTTAKPLVDISSPDGLTLDERMAKFQKEHWDYIKKTTLPPYGPTDDNAQ